MVGYSRMLGYPPMPVLRPWRFHTHLGMDVAVMMLMWSMEKGKTGATVMKYTTAKKACATLTMLWESSLSGRDDLTF
jgi:hypothetical protein